MQKVIMSRDVIYIGNGEYQANRYIIYSKKWSHGIIVGNFHVMIIPKKSIHNYIVNRKKIKISTEQSNILKLMVMIFYEKSVYYHSGFNYGKRKVLIPILFSHRACFNYLKSLYGEEKNLQKCYY